MASSNKTANLELSQFVGSDKPDWLTDYNGDMLKIDNSVGDVSAAAEVAARNAQIAADNAAAAITKADSAVEQIGGIVDTVTRAEEVADRAESVANNALTVANNTASLASDAVGLANEALAKAASAKTQAESAVASAGEAVTTANSAKDIADAAADDVAGAVSAADAATAAVGAMDGRVSDIEDVIPNSATDQNQLATAADVSAVSSSVAGVSGRVTAIENVVPNNASASNMLATMADVAGGGSVTVDTALNASSNNPVTNAAITTAINAEHTRVDEIEALIPVSATAQNQLATMADVGGGGEKIAEVSGDGTKWRMDLIRELASQITDKTILVTRLSYIKYTEDTTRIFILPIHGTNSDGRYTQYGSPAIQLPQLVDSACKGVAVYFGPNDFQMATVTPSGTVTRIDNQVAAISEKLELYLL